MLVVIIYGLLASIFVAAFFFAFAIGTVLVEGPDSRDRVSGRRASRGRELEDSPNVAA